MFYCEPLDLDLMVQETSRGWGNFSRRCPGAAWWLHGRKRAELAGDGGEGTRKLGFRREGYWEQERTIANSPRVLLELGRSWGRHTTQNRGRHFLCMFGTDVRTNERVRKLGKRLGSFVTSTRSSVRGQIRWNGSESRVARWRACSSFGEILPARRRNYGGLGLLRMGKRATKRLTRPYRVLG